MSAFTRETCNLEVSSSLKTKHRMTDTLTFETVTIGPPPLTAFLTFISRKENSQSYTHLILALGIVREPTVWGFITSKYIFDEK